MTALYTRYRSQRFDDLVGQDALVQTLKNALRTDRVAHAYLFAGIRGTGKTSTARILAKAVNCLDPQDGEPDNTCANCVAITESAATDLIEIDAASNRGIDEMRDLREKAKYMPALLKRKVYIIDEAHQLTGDAFNALLKTLEEPPGHVLFILCTTEAHKLPETVVSRCQRFEFRRIDEAAIAGRLRHIADVEKIACAEDGIALVAAMAQGSMRDAVTMLDQVASSGAELLDAPTVRRQLGLVEASELVTLLAECAGGQGGAALRRLDGLVQQGADLRQLTYSLAEVARRLLLAELAAGVGGGLVLDAAAAAELEALARSTAPGFARAAFELAVSAAAEMRQAHDPRLVLELVLVRLASGTPAVPVPAPHQHVPAEPRAEVAAVVVEAPAQPAPAAPPPAVAEAPAIATPPEPAVPVAPGDGSLADVVARWERLLEALRGSTPGVRLKALLNDGAPISLQGDQLTIAFRYALHRDRAEEPTHRQALEAALSQVFGQTFRLQFKVDPELRPTRVPAGTPGPVADVAADPAPPASPAGPRAADEEDLPRAAVEILGGRITDIRPRGVREPG